MSTPDWIALKPLLDDLRGRVMHPALDVRTKAGELGNFIEDLKRCLVVLSGAPEKSDLASLHKPLLKLSPHLHDSIIAELIPVYKRRCLAAHSNLACPQPEEVPADLERVIGVIRKLCPFLVGVRDGAGRGFAEVLFAEQCGARAIRLADELASALLLALPPDGALALARRELVRLQVDIGSDELVGTAVEVLRALLRHLASRTVGGRPEALFRVAMEARTELGPQGAAALDPWFGLAEVAVPSARARRLDVLAIYLRSRSGGGHELAGWWLVSPSVPGIERRVPLVLPIAAPTPEALYNAVTRLTQVLAPALHQLPGGAIELAWHRVVLVIHVDHAEAGEPFERAGLGFKMLTRAFRAVAVCPRNESALGVTSSAVKVDPPFLKNANSVGFASERDLAEAWTASRDKVAAFHGPWGAPAGKHAGLPAVEIFDNHPCAVVSRTMPLDAALEVLFPEGSDLEIGTLFDRVTELRQSQDVLLLWADPDYSPAELTAI